MQLKKVFKILFVSILFSSCVSVKLRTADTYYDQLQYQNAIPYYELVMRKKYSDDVMIKLADCYRNVNNYSRSEQLYSRLVNLSINPQFVYYYAEALMQNGKYIEAKKYFEKYLSTNRNDERAARKLASCDSIQSLYKDSALYSVSLLKFNRPLESNYSPAIYKSGIVYVSNRNPDERALKSNSTVDDYNLFYAKKTESGNWLEPEVLRGNINSMFNEGPCVFTKNFAAAYITRNDNEGKKIVTNQKDVNVLKIYKANFNEGIWNVEGEMQFNSPDYSVGHPALNEKGNIMYFVADMPWGYGGTDIYRTENVGGTWTQPVNLGKNINTTGNEMFPFLANDSVLYFSSNGNIGLGGLDIYRSSKASGEWSVPENIGYPVNSPKDDFGFVCDDNELSGYFSSSRTGGTDKIFSFSRNEPVLSLLGVITEKTTGKEIKDVRIAVNSGGNDTIISTNENGVYYLPVKSNVTYLLSISEKGYFGTSLKFSTGTVRKSTDFVENISLEKVVLNKPIAWRGISFLKGEYSIKPAAAVELDKLFSILQNNPYYRIELSSHTDSRGNDKDNLILSQHRADAAAEYLYAKGIARERVLAVGYGETKLLNECHNGILCLEEDHQINNRIEIKYFSFGK